MAVIRLILRYEDNIGLRYVRKVRDARWDGVFREQPFGMPHRRGTREPWINEDGESPRSLVETWRREWLIAGGSEGDEEGRVAIELSDFDRHDVHVDVPIELMFL